VTPLPQPEVVGCYFDIGFVPPIAAMVLRWPGPAGLDARAWTLPGGEALHGPLPRRFGVRIRRQDQDAYNVTVVWDSTYRQWFSLRRREVQASALEPVLAAMGTRLDYLLEQPLESPDRPLPPLPGAA
jgi:hypothetical protein